METATIADTITTAANNRTISQIINPSNNDIKMKSCPVDNTFKIIGRKFTILIIRNVINSKQNRFNQLLKSLEGANPKTLSVRLREMEKIGLIKRKGYTHESPIKGNAKELVTLL